MWTWLKKLGEHLRRPTVDDLITEYVAKPAAREIVLIDGDQGFSPHVTRKILVPKPGVRYIWVQHKRTFVPKGVMQKVTVGEVELVKPSDVGKESVDTYIAMELVRLCLMERPKTAIIVSADADFVDILVNAASMFPDVTFHLMVHKHGQPMKNIVRSTLPSNARIICFNVPKPPPVKSSKRATWVY